MPRLVTKFKYSKTGSRHRENLLEYIATRDGVEAPSPEQYLKYINYRPRSHGLFSSVGQDIDLKEAINQMTAHKGKVWTAIFSLTREDAERLGYDNADSWQKLLDANADVFANQMMIPQEDFRWYAAFHNEGHHPHVHMVMYSANPKNERLSQVGIDRIRSTIAGQIFKHDLTAIYEDQTKMRNALTEKAKDEFLKTIAELSMNPDAQPEMTGLLNQLSEQLKTAKGKKVYGYLPAATKKTVDQIVDLLGENEKVRNAYSAWYRLRQEVLHTYRDDGEEEKPLSQQKEFKQIKNMIIRELLQSERFPVSDREMSPHLEIEEEDMRVEVAGENADAELRQLIKRKNILTKKAEQGDSTAMYLLAKEYLNPESSLHNTETAFGWLKKAEAAGNDMAEYRLAKLYLQGEGVPKDTKIAIQYLKSASEKGNRYADYLLGKIYAFGTEDIQRDWKAALPHFQSAADAGNPYAQKILDCHEQYRMEQLQFAASQMAIAFAELLENRQPHPPNQPAAKIDRKRLRELRRKKMAQGHARDDMEIKF